MADNPAGTENSLTNLEGFETWGDDRILRTLLEGQHRALAAVEMALPRIAEAAGIIAKAVAAGGRLIYAGAGTSIRVAVQDGSELPATFGMAEDQLHYLIAGGRAAMFETLADAEDDEMAGRSAAATCSAADVLVAVAASGKTPYTCAAAREAGSRGTPVIAVVNNPGSPLAKLADVEVLLQSGPEVISGSTRMGAGTAQKAALNLMSTLAHTRLGAVYDGLMVNVQAGNSKLQARAAGIVSKITGAPQGLAETALQAAEGSVKLAVLLASARIAPATGKNILTASHGNLRLALASLKDRV